MVMVSPTCAWREGTPGMALGGSTKVLPSENTAATYCLPPTLNDAGASMPGSTVFTVTVYGPAIPLAVTRITGCGPRLTLDGTCTFTCVPLMNSTNADWPLMYTEVRSSDVGAFTPVKSLPVHKRVSAARLEP